MNNEKPLGNEETQEKEIMRARQKVEDILQKFYSLKEYIQEYVDCNRRKENLPVYMKREKEHFDSCEASLTEAIQIREEKIEKLKKLFDEVEQSAHSLSGPESVPELTKKIYLHNSALNAVKFQDSQIASYKKLHAQHYQKYSDYRKNLEDAQSMLDQLYNELDALLRGSDIEELKKFIGNHMQREDLVEELDQNLNEIVHPERRASVLQALQNIERALLTEEFCLEGGELIDEPCFDRNEYRKMYRVSTSHSPVRRGRGRKPERFQKETDLQVQIRWLIRRDMPEVLSIEEEKEEEEGDKKSEEEFLSFLRQRNNIGMVAEINHEIVSFMLYELHKSKMHIDDFGVRKSEQRQGVGTQMMHRVIDKLCQQRRTNIEIIIKETNKQMLSFLQKMGFDAIELLPEEFWDKRDGILMRHTLYQEPSADPWGPGFNKENNQ